MIKLNFEFDSKDSVSSQLYDWLSSCPLEQGCLKMTTSLDYTDPKTNRNHRVGNIILDITPEEVTNSVLQTSQKNAAAPKNRIEPSVAGSNNDSKKQTESDNILTDKSVQSKKDSMDQKNASSKEITANKAPAAPNPPMTSIQPTPSFDYSFESGFDESILAAVAFTDEEDATEASDQNPMQNKDKPESNAENLTPTPESNEDNETASNFVPSDSDSAAVSLRNEDSGSEDYDFLLNSLDEFNV